MDQRTDGAVPAPLYHDEAGRLAVLREYGVLDTLPEVSFDDIVFLASYICEAPMAMVSLVDEDRQWFKAKVGTDLKETPRDAAFCAHAILQPDEIFVVPDAHQDPRFATNPLVRAEPNIRFYAGAPLVSPEGMPLGTLCVADEVPGYLSPKQTRALAALAREVVVHLELRRVIAALTKPLAELSSDPMLEPGVRDELRQASEEAASASALVGQAMERVLEAELRMQNLVNRVRTVQSRPQPLPGG
ncbi:MAG TPA: GAF domain-containing protein [Acidimicrobiia bacterium]|nr:GAF domain-containing protein [Acidimicrobiia bacterium]